MSPEHQQPNSENANAELAFVQQALAAADRSERSSRIIVGVLAILWIVEESRGATTDEIRKLCKGSSKH
jgi:hypothetical protein